MRSTVALVLLFPAFLLACNGSKTGNTSHNDSDDGGLDDGGLDDDGGPVANAAPNSLDDVIAALVTANGASNVTAALDSFVAGIITDPTTQQAIDAQIASRVAGATAGPFPVITFAQLATAETLLDEYSPSNAATADAGPIAFNLTPPAAGTTCTPVLPTLTPISAQLPGLTEGDIPDPNGDPCTQQQLENLVTALNGMAMNDGSTVTDGTNTYSTVADTFTDLLTTHTITVDANRYYADFLGLVYNGVSVAAPVWIDYGIPLPNGGTLTLPVPHAGYAILISGPQINGTIEFYLGVTGGTEFRADVALPRAPWRGGLPRDVYNSGTDNAKIVLAMQTASDLRNKWTTQATAQNLPFLGYGTLGVCMDSAAVIEDRVEGTITLFPLLHPPTTTINDYIDMILSTLPVDLQGFTDADAISRIGTSAPMSGSQLQSLFPLAATELSSLGILPAN
jgi:hypothetical protein